MDPHEAPAHRGNPESPPLWSVTLDELLAVTETGGHGLSLEDAARRSARDGPNTIDMPHTHRLLHALVAQFTSPIVLILVAASVLSFARGRRADAGLGSWVRSAPDTRPRRVGGREHPGMAHDRRRFDGAPIMVQYLRGGTEARAGSFGAVGPDEDSSGARRRAVGYDDRARCVMQDVHADPA